MLNFSGVQEAESHRWRTGSCELHEEEVNRAVV